jgi:hypothetical protein
LKCRRSAETFSDPPVAVAMVLRLRLAA